MKKLLLLLLLVRFPHLVFAQSDPPIYKDFFKDIKSASPLVLNDHVNVMLIEVDNDNFNLVAVDDKMQVVWNTAFKGFGLSVSKFKGKLVAVAGTDFSTMKGGTANAYKAFLVDPSNGKVLIEKMIYAGADDYTEYPAIITGDGNYFKLAMRKSGIERRLHVSAPIVVLFTINNIAREFHQTKEFTVITFDDKLDVTNSFKPVLPDGTMVNLQGNKQGDLFISWLNGSTLDVYKYDNGKMTPSSKASANVSLSESNGITPSEHIMLLPSEINRNVAFFGIAVTNDDNGTNFGLGKLDFSTGKQIFANETFDKDHVKSIEKAFVPINKKINNANLGARRDLRIKFMKETNDALVVGLTSKYTEKTSQSFRTIENSTLINSYDDNLNLKFQQIFPSNYNVRSISLPSGYSIQKNKLYIVGNENKGLSSFEAIYGKLDLKTGKWDRMEVLSKKGLGGSDFAYGTAILWYDNNYIVPYFDIHGFLSVKYDITLQQNDY